MTHRFLALLTSLSIVVAASACSSSAGSSGSPAAPSVATPAPTPNRAPVIDSVTASPSVGLQASTTVTFSANASDADGDPLQYQWTFGDGGTASDETVSHLYQTGGMMTVSVAVSDTKATTTKETLINIVSLSGIWWSPDPCGSAGSGAVPCASQQGFYFTLSQTGTTVTGNWQVFTLGPGPFLTRFFNVYPVSGSVSTSSPRISLDVAARGTSGNPIPECFSLDPNDDVTALSGSYVGGVCGGTPVTRTIPRSPFVRTTTMPHP
jgi:PKD repeat protein